jgi:hypothetical protein
VSEMLCPIAGLLVVEFEGIAPGDGDVFLLEK